MRDAKATKETFTPREGFDPNYLGDTRSVRVRYAKPIARWKVERGAEPLADGSAVRDLRVGSEEWLESEILADRGHAVVLDPPQQRVKIAKRAKALARELEKPPARAAR
jgi:WYL domain